jgi:hypothetical protein
MIAHLKVLGVFAAFAVYFYGLYKLFNYDMDHQTWWGFVFLFGPLGIISIGGLYCALLDVFR